MLLPNPHRISTFPLECKPRARFLPAQMTSCFFFLWTATKIVFGEQIHFWKPAVYKTQQVIKITSNLFTSILKFPPHWQRPTRPVHLNTLKASQIQQMPPNYCTHPVFVPNFFYLRYVKQLALSSLRIYLEFYLLQLYQNYSGFSKFPKSFLFTI